MPFLLASHVHALLQGRFAWLHLAWTVFAVPQFMHRGVVACSQQLHCVLWFFPRRLIFITTIRRSAKWLTCWSVMPEVVSLKSAVDGYFSTSSPKRCESRDGYRSAIKMPAVKVSWNFFFTLPLWHYSRDVRSHWDEIHKEPPGWNMM